MRIAIHALAAVATVGAVQGCSVLLRDAAGIGAVEFQNFSAADVIEIDRLSDQDGVRWIQGWVPAPFGPGAILGYATGSVIRIPRSFQVQFKVNGVPRGVELPTERLVEALEEEPNPEDATLYFVYTRRRQLALKLGFDRGYRSDGRPLIELWPDRQDPDYQRLAELRSRILERDVEGMRRLLQDGAPFFLDDPTTRSPLEEQELFSSDTALSQVLIDFIPPDYPLHRFALCVRVAAERDRTDDLSRLLAHPKSEALSEGDLVAIVYGAFYFADETSTLEMLFERFDVDVDLRLRDYGHTPLFIAVDRDYEPFVSWLLARGADVQATLENGSRPIDWAKSDAVRELLSHGR